MSDSLSSSHDLPLFLSVFASLSCLYVGETERVPLCFSLFSLHLSLCLVVLAFLPCLCGCLFSCFSVLSVSMWVSLSFMLFCLVSNYRCPTVSFTPFLTFCLVCFFLSVFAFLSCLYMGISILSIFVFLSHFHLGICPSVSPTVIFVSFSVSLFVSLCLSVSLSLSSVSFTFCFSLPSSLSFFQVSVCVCLGLSFFLSVSLSIFSCTFGLVHAGDTFSRSGKTGQEKKKRSKFWFVVNRHLEGCEELWRFHWLNCWMKKSCQWNVCLWPQPWRSSCSPSFSRWQHVLRYSNTTQTQCSTLIHG